MARLFLLFLFQIILFSGLKAQWSAVGGQNRPPSVNSTEKVCMDSAGNIYAAAYMGNTSFGVCKWNGANWQMLTGGFQFPSLESIYALCTDNRGNVYAAGSFTNRNGYRFVAKWDGTSWAELGGTNSFGPASENIYALYCGPSGEIYAAGAFHNSQVNNYVAKWDGTSWTELGGPNSMGAYGFIFDLAMDSQGNLYAAGGFGNLPGKRNILKFNGATWSGLAANDSSTFNGFIRDICIDKDDSIYAAGEFYINVNLSSVRYYVVKLTDTGWVEFGHVGIPNSIQSICADTATNIYAATRYINTTLQDYRSYIIKYDSATYKLGGGDAPGYISQICTDLRGNLYAAGAFRDNTNNGYLAKFAGAYLAKYVTVQNGNWSDPATWAYGLVPPTGAHVTVRHQLTIDVNVVCASLTVDPGTPDVIVLPGVTVVIR